MTFDWLYLIHFDVWCRMKEETNGSWFRWKVFKLSCNIPSVFLGCFCSGCCCRYSLLFGLVVCFGSLFCLSLALVFVMRSQTEQLKAKDCTAKAAVGSHCCCCWLLVRSFVRLLACLQPSNSTVCLTARYEPPRAATTLKPDQLEKPTTTTTTIRLDFLRYYFCSTFAHSLKFSAIRSFAWSYNRSLVRNRIVRCKFCLPFLFYAQTRLLMCSIFLFPHSNICSC